MNDQMNVGDRVRFKGPRYKSGSQEFGPLIGQLGTITARNGNHMQKAQAGENNTVLMSEKEELITVEFDGSERPTVLSINRIEPA